MASLKALMVIFVSGLLCLLQKVHSAEFISGGEARRVCKAYKMICPARKTCVLQSIEWPRPMKFPVCVHEKDVIVKSSICKKPPQPGKCEAKFMRWYFNVHMGACSWFTYGGCGGNQNNFRTAEECQRRCMSQEERREARRNSRREDANNVVVVGDDDENNEDEDDETEETDEIRTPTLITAPARAPEMIELDNDVKASLQLSTNQNNATAAWKEERRRRRKERRRRRRRQRNKRKRKNRRNETGFSRQGEDTPEVRQPTRKLTPLELGPNYSATEATERNSPSYQEVRGRPTAFARFNDESDDERQVWMMDRRFRRRRRRRRNRGRKVDAVAEVRGDSRGDTHDDSRPIYAGAGQDTYYDRVKLFDILKNQQEETTNRV